MSMPQASEIWLDHESPTPWPPCLAVPCAVVAVALTCVRGSSCRVLFSFGLGCDVSSLHEKCAFSLHVSLQQKQQQQQQRHQQQQQQGGAGGGNAGRDGASAVTDANEVGNTFPTLK